MPVTEVVGDRLLLTSSSPSRSILFTWAVAFPIGDLFGDAPVQLGRPRADLPRLPRPRHAELPAGAGAAVLRQRRWFGISIGGLMDPEFLGQPWSWAKFASVLEHLWIPVIVIGTGGTAA